MDNHGTRITPVLLITLLFLPIMVSAQSTNSRLSESAAGLLDPVYGVDQRLVSGSFYYGPQKGSITGHPYYIDEMWKKGSVTIGDLIYDSLNLKYDIENNELILMYTNIYNSILQISLRKQAIQNFVMSNMLFVPYPGTDQNEEVLFCEVITSGEINYLILKNKSLVLTNGGVTDYEYREYIDQFLQIKDQLIPFKRWRTIYKLYPEHKQELNRYLISKGLSPMKNRINDRKAMVFYLNQLISKQF